MPDFGYTKVTEGQKDILERLASRFQEMESFILAAVPAGRRRTLVITKLEEAAMWAAKSVAKEVPEQNGNAPLITEPIN